MNKFVTSLGFVIFSCQVIYATANSYSFPQTNIVVTSDQTLFTDGKTGGFTNQAKNFQMLAFEFDQKQPNNLMIRALKQTWKNSGHTILSQKEISVSGFWGEEIRTKQKVNGKTSYTRNLVFGDFYKMAQVSVVCPKKDPKEHCKGSEDLLSDIKWNYKDKGDLSDLKSKIKLPGNYKLYLRVNTKKGPVLMFTPKAKPLSGDDVPSLNFAINKGEISTQDFMSSFAKSSEMTGVKPQASNVKSKRTKEPLFYSWGKRGASPENYYLSCVKLDEQKKFNLLVCGTAAQKNYQQLHQSLFELASQ